MIDKKEWDGDCTTCRWFDSDDKSEPCSLCFGCGRFHESDAPCYFDAELIESPDAERDVDAYLSGVKDKAGKPRMSLILPHAAEALVRVREYGLKKYPDANNWKKVDKADWCDALMRHLMKYLAGEEIDAESGMPHLWHALANLSYMIEG